MLQLVRDLLRGRLRGANVPCLVRSLAARALLSVGGCWELLLVMLQARSRWRARLTLDVGTRPPPLSPAECHLHE